MDHMNESEMLAAMNDNIDRARNCLTSSSPMETKEAIDHLERAVGWLKRIHTEENSRIFESARRRGVSANG
jgi:hypothetical protein